MTDQTEKKLKKLTNGLIPAHTACPFKGRCGSDRRGECAHRGEQHTHTQPFSCGLARAFDTFSGPA